MTKHHCIEPDYCPQNPVFCPQHENYKQAVSCLRDQECYITSNNNSKNNKTNKNITGG